MKKIILATLLITTLQYTFAQGHPFKCETVFTPEMRNYEVHLAAEKKAMATPPTPDLLTPYVFNLRFWQINDGDGHNIIGNHNFGEDVEIMEFVKMLNNAFNASNIFFKYKGFETVNNGDFTNFVSNLDYLDAFYTNTEVTHNSFNIIFANSKGESLPVDPYTYHPYHAIVLGMTEMAATQSNLAKFILCHEMGHLLGLFHTDGSLNTWTGEFECEHVNGDNATDHGDFIVDTPAEPFTTYWSEDFDANCQYINSHNQYDCNDIPELYTGIIPNNYLQLVDVLQTSSNSCVPFHFTPGQTAKMRETIVNTPTQYYGSHNLGLSMTEVSSLYIPYSRDKLIFAPIISTTDNGNGTAHVCRGYIDSDFKFQAGFTYSFLEEPYETATVLSTFSANTSPVIIAGPAFNCPVRIAELAPGQTNLTTNIGQTETSCHGQVCVDEEFVNGTVIRTPNLLDTNYTIEQLNAIQVKDPQLYNNLISQYYYKIRKETNSGAKTEEVFYKQ